MKILVPRFALMLATVAFCLFAVFDQPVTAQKTDSGLNITSLGAKGDGKSDDRAAFQLALDRADPSKGGSGKVIVPPSQKPYLLSSAIEIHSGETLEAQPGTVEIAPYFPYVGESKGALLLRAQDVSNVKVQGLSFDGAGNKSDTRPVIFVYQSEHIVFEQCDVKNARGLAMEFNGGKKGVSFSGARKCKFENDGQVYLQTGDKKEDRRQSLVFCISPTNERGEFLSQHNFAEGCTLGVNGFDNLSLSQQSYFTASHNHFVGNNNGANIYCSHNRHVRIIGNYSKQASGNGIDCFVNFDLYVTKNTSEQNGGAGIMVCDTTCGGVVDNKTIANYQAVRPEWAKLHPGATAASKHRGGITIGGEKGDGTPTLGESNAASQGGTVNLLISNNLSGDNQAPQERTQMYGIQVRNTAAVKGLLVTPDNKLFGNTHGPFGEQLTGFTAAPGAHLPCSLWRGDEVQ